MDQPLTLSSRRAGDPLPLRTLFGIARDQYSAAAHRRAGNQQIHRSDDQAPGFQLCAAPLARRLHFSIPQLLNSSIPPHPPPKQENTERSQSESSPHQNHLKPQQLTHDRRLSPATPPKPTPASKRPSTRPERANTYHPPRLPARPPQLARLRYVPSVHTTNTRHVTPLPAISSTSRTQARQALD